MRNGRRPLLGRMDPAEDGKGGSEPLRVWTHLNRSAAHVCSRFCAVIKIDTKRINRDDEVGTGLSGMKEEQNQNMKVTAVGCRNRRSPILSVSLQLSIKYFMFLSERGRYSEMFDCPYSEVTYDIHHVRLRKEIVIFCVTQFINVSFLVTLLLQSWLKLFNNDSKASSTIYMIATVCCLSANILPGDDKWWYFDHRRQKSISDQPSTPTQDQQNSIIRWARSLLFPFLF